MLTNTHEAVVRKLPPQHILYVKYFKVTIATAIVSGGGGVCVYTYVSGYLKPEEELQLWVFGCGSPRVCSGIQTQVLCNSSKCS